WFGLGIYFAGYQFAIEGAIFRHMWFFFAGAVICLVGGLLFLFRRRSKPGDFQHRAAEIAQRQEDLRRAIWRKRAGDQLDEMLESPDAAVRSLNNPDPQIRITAIEVIEDFNKRGIAIEIDMAEIARADADPTVRQRAKFSLAKRLLSIDDGAAKRMIAEL